MNGEQRSGVVPPTPPLQFGGSLQEQVDAGSKVEALLDSEGFDVLRAAIKQTQDRMVAVDLMAKRPTWNGAEYASVVGKLNGLALVESVAAAVVKAGKDAAGELRAAETEGDS